MLPERVVAPNMKRHLNHWNWENSCLFINYFLYMAFSESGSNVTDCSIWILKVIEASELLRTNQMPQNTLHGTSSWSIISWKVPECSWPDLNHSKHALYLPFQMAELSTMSAMLQLAYWRQTRALLKKAVKRQHYRPYIESVGKIQCIWWCKFLAESNYCF